MNVFKKAVFAAAVASETCLSMQEECYAGTFDCARFRALCSVYGLD